MIAERHCTDVLFLIIFGAFWVGMLVVGIVAFSEARSSGVNYAGLFAHGVPVPSALSSASDGLVVAYQCECLRLKPKTCA
jgi:hypothetical protein